MLDKLIGAQIVGMSEESIEVKLDGKTYTLEIDSDYGGCCGYANFTTKLLYSKQDLRNPIITNIEMDSGDESYCDSSIVTFYGEHKELASIECEAGSGSGWSYGAFVSLQCKALDIDENLVSW